MAEKELRKGGSLASYGALLHNEMEMQRLERCGLSLVGKKDFPALGGKKVLFRAHGEPPESYALANSNRLDIIDTTCGVVRQLQQKVLRAATEMRGAGGQVVIYGKKGHPEVIGLLGQAGAEGILVSQGSDLEKVDLSKPVRMFSQTTMDKDVYAEVSGILRERMLKKGNEDFVSDNTICKHVINRIPSLKDFAASHDVIIFVSGRDSSNGKKLFNVSRKVNPRTHFISEPDELDADWFAGAGRVGISGAASTPQWLMQDVAMKIQAMN